MIRQKFCVLGVSLEALHCFVVNFALWLRWKSGFSTINLTISPFVINDVLWRDILKPHKYSFLNVTLPMNFSIN